MSRTVWQAAFDKAAVDGKINSPGVAGVVVLLEGLCGAHVDRAEVEEYFVRFGKAVDSDFDCADFFTLREHLGVESDADEDDVDSIVNAIVQQYDREEQFVVKPDQVEGENEKSEASMLCEVTDAMKVEAALIQSSQDAMFASFIASSPIESDVPMPVRRARYARELFYVNLRKVLEDQARTSRVFPRAMILGKFVPWVLVSKAVGMSAEDAQKLVDDVEATHVQEFERVFFERWDTIAASAMYSAQSLESLFSRFVAEEYYVLLRVAVERGQRFFYSKVWR